MGFQKQWDPSKQIVSDRLIKPRNANTYSKYQPTEIDRIVHQVQMDTRAEEQRRLKVPGRLGGPRMILSAFLLSAWIAIVAYLMAHITMLKVIP